MSDRLKSTRSGASGRVADGHGDMGWRHRIGALVRRLAIGMGALALAWSAAAAPATPAAAASVAEGRLEVLVEDYPASSRTRHFLHTAEGRLELRVSGRRPAWVSGTRLRVRGVRTAGVMALDGSDSGSVTVLATPTSSTSGEQRVGVLLVNFQDNTTQPYTLAQAQDVVFAQTSGYYRENSFQRTWLTGSAFGWLTLPMASSCLTSDIAAAAKQAAAVAGIDLSPYSRLVYVFPRNAACGWSGVGTVGGSTGDVWINGRLELKVVAHELGHNFGLQHAHASDCDATPLGSTCTAQEYGDVADVMGNTTAGHFGAFHKERLGWLGGGAAQQITTVTATGTYAIGAYESATAEAKALKIPKGVDPLTGARTWYYVEFRQPLGYDGALAGVYASNLLNGLLVRVATEGDRNSSYLLDMTPGTVPTFDMGDAALTYGQVFTDSAAGVSVNLESLATDRAAVRVTLSASTSCVRANPTLSLGAAGASVAAGTAVGYTLNVRNADSAGCAAAGFDLQPQLPGGWSAALASTTLTLAPGATVAVPVSITSAGSAAAGTYTVGITALHRDAAGYGATASSSYTVAASAVLSSSSVSTDRAIYARGDTVRMSATVLSGGQPVAKAKVSFRLVKADGTVVVQSATTSGSGVATSSYRLGRRDPVGSWQLEGSASTAAGSTSAQAGFAVQ